MPVRNPQKRQRHASFCSSSSIPPLPRKIVLTRVSCTFACAWGRANLSRTETLVFGLSSLESPVHVFKFWGLRVLLSSGSVFRFSIGSLLISVHSCVVFMWADSIWWFKVHELLFWRNNKQRMVLFLFRSQIDEARDSRVYAVLIRFDLNGCRICQCILSKLFKQYRGNSNHPCVAKKLFEFYLSYWK